MHTNDSPYIRFLRSALADKLRKAAGNLKVEKGHTVRLRRDMRSIRKAVLGGGK